MFNRSIAVIGTKGGTGKTTCSHMLAYGLAHFDIATTLVTTDATQGRVVLNDEHRRYQTVGGQSGEALNNIFAVFNDLEVNPEIPRVLIIDGGGNRVDIDKLFIQATDMAILPFRDSAEDRRVVSADLQQHHNAYGLPSSWPANLFTQTQATAVLDQMREAFPGRILQPIPAIRSSQTLLLEDPGPIDTKLRSVCKALAFDVMNKLGINLFDINRR